MNGQHEYSLMWLFFLIPFNVIADQADGFNNVSASTLFGNFWYLPIVFAGLFLAFWLIANIRYRLKMKRLAEIEQIRKSAAQDFHDELGSKLSVISMYAQLAKTQMNGHNFEADQYLEKVIQTSNSLYGSMKDLLWTLNPEKDSLQELMYQLCDFGDELFEHSLITFTAKRPEKFTDVKLNMNLKRHILLIFKEAMNNCLKHSFAQHAMLTFSIQKNILIIDFQDNGEGLDLASASKGDGIRNMKLRAKKIDAQLKIANLEKGMVVNLTCDLSKAREFSA